MITARPRRMSEVNTATKILPIPPGTSFFLFSQTNRFLCFSFNNTSVFFDYPILDTPNLIVPVCVCVA